MRQRDVVIAHTSQNMFNLKSTQDTANLHLPSEIYRSCIPKSSDSFWVTGLKLILNMKLDQNLQIIVKPNPKIHVELLELC